MTIGESRLMQRKGRRTPRDGRLRAVMIAVRSADWRRDHVNAIYMIGRRARMRMLRQ